MTKNFLNSTQFLCLIGVIACASAAFVFFNTTNRNGYIYCLKFPITKAAQDAFACGNHYFGIYDASAYDIVKAEDYFGRAVEIDPKFPDAWHQYARIAFLKGDFGTALYRINKQFEYRGDELVDSYYIRGLIEGYAKDYPAAERDFSKFLEFDPKNWAANNDLAWIYFAQGKFKESLAQADLGLSYNGENPWLVVMRAMSLYNLGDEETALVDLRTAQRKAEMLTEDDWSRAYPGNDPAVAGRGLAAFKEAIRQNLALIHTETSD
jgi:tetratricopeptide (TPR) repeat protein